MQYHYIPIGRVSEVKVVQSCSTLCDPMDYTVHGILQVRILEWVAFPFSRGSSQTRDLTQVSHIAADSLPAEPQGKPENTGGVSLSLLQGIFLIQESNQGLLHYRKILYQLSYKSRKTTVTKCFWLQPECVSWFLLKYVFSDIFCRAFKVFFEFLVYIFALLFDVESWHFDWGSPVADLETWIGGQLVYLGEVPPAGASGKRRSPQRCVAIRGK